MVSSLHHVSIFVKDMDRAIRLFRDILGFNLSWRVERARGRVLSSLLGIREVEAELAYLESGSKGTAVEISRLIRPAMEDSPNDFGNAGTCSFGLCVDNLEELHVRLAREGWTPLSSCLDLNPPGGSPARAFCVRIESGVLLELLEIRDKCSWEAGGS
jgi:catechol 2,3-dioxygenase-like lactoylglutathione lyase family enzyme